MVFQASRCTSIPRDGRILNVRSAVAIDGAPAVLLDLTYHRHTVIEGRAATVVGAAVGLMKTTHTLTGKPFVVCGAIL